MLYVLERSTFFNFIALYLISLQFYNYILAHFFEFSTLKMLLDNPNVLNHLLLQQDNLNNLLQQNNLIFGCLVNIFNLSKSNLYMYVQITIIYLLLYLLYVWIRASIHTYVHISRTATFIFTHSWTEYSYNKF